MKTVCEKDKCSGCMACLEICPKQAITVCEEMTAYNAIIDESKCINCNLCHAQCQSNHPAKAKKPIQWWQGWAKEPTVREHSSSGGAAAAIELAFVKEGGVVCSCAFENGEFTFSFAENAEQLWKFAGSKYVKSNPKDIYKKIRELLQAGRKVLFVGLPCQAAAVKNFIGEQLQEQLYLVDLICHGSPSPKVLDAFLKQYRLQLKDLKEINFRTKAVFQTNADTKYLTKLGTKDCYTIAFLNALCYTENCYQCHYATAERVSDVTLGDSWGSEMEDMAEGKGLSLILCQTEKGCSLVEHAKLALYDVDIERAMEHNHQLREPCKRPPQRDNFFEMLQNGGSFNNAVMKAYRKQCIKQRLKGVLIKLGIIPPRGGGVNYRISVK